MCAYLFQPVGRRYEQTGHVPDRQVRVALQRSVKYRREMTLRPVRPMIAASATVLPTGDEWSYEVKWDGYRSLALKDGPGVRLVSRNSKDLTAQ
jgi:bifunctional non-homologous end joining protein LigD